MIASQAEGSTEYLHSRRAWGGEMKTSELAEAILYTWFTLERTHGVENAELILEEAASLATFTGLNRGMQHSREAIAAKLNRMEKTAPGKQGTIALIRSMLDQFDKVSEAAEK